MEVRLKVLAGVNAGKELPVPGPKFFIGRSEECQLQPKSDLIIRHHCVILVEPDQVSVRDLGSRNGTFVNDQRITTETPLAAADRLKIGPLEFELVVVQKQVAKKRPKVSSIKEVLTRTAEGSPTSSEFDVSNWLEGSEQETVTREMSASQVNLSTRTTIVNATDAAIQNTPVPDGPPEAASPAEVTPAPPIRPKPAAPKGGDSGKAAADVLRNFFKRR